MLILSNIPGLVGYVRTPVIKIFVKIEILIILFEKIQRSSLDTTLNCRIVRVEKNKDQRFKKSGKLENLKKSVFYKKKIITFCFSIKMAEILAVSSSVTSL